MYLFMVTASKCFVHKSAMFSSPGTLDTEGCAQIQKPLRQDAASPQTRRNDECGDAPPEARFRGKGRS